MELLEYQTANGHSPFASWFDGLDATAAAKIVVALNRIGQDNLSNVKSVGSGVFEYRINWGPGYRIYLAREGNRIIILLTGGTKHRQQRDINNAQDFWRDYKKRKKDI